MKNRAAYREIRRDLLSTYLTGCVNRGFRGEDHEAVCSWAYCEYDGAYELPIEKLMFELAALGLTGGWYPDIEKSVRAKISSILFENSLREMVDSIENEEAEELIRDLRVLGVVGREFEF